MRTLDVDKLAKFIVFRRKRCHRQGRLRKVKKARSGEVIYGLFWTSISGKDKEIASGNEDFVIYFFTRQVTELCLPCRFCTGRSKWFMVCLHVEYELKDWHWKEQQRDIRNFGTREHVNVYLQCFFQFPKIIFGTGKTHCTMKTFCGALKG